MQLQEHARLNPAQQSPPHLLQLLLRVLLVLGVGQHRVHAPQAELLLRTCTVQLGRQQLHMHAAVGVAALLTRGLQEGQVLNTQRAVWQGACTRAPQYTTCTDDCSTRTWAMVKASTRPTACGLALMRTTSPLLMVRVPSASTGGTSGGGSAL